jgi:hypothetical protein
MPLTTSFFPRLLSGRAVRDDLVIPHRRIRFWVTTPGGLREAQIISAIPLCP